MNTYRKLQKRVNEILKRDTTYAEYGDEILIYNDGYDYREVIYLSEKNDVINFAYLDYNVHEIESISKNDVQEILGKPPTLQDLLRCIHISHSYFNSLLNFLCLKKDEEEFDLFDQLDLSKDIKDQDEEVLESIYKLIT